MRPQLQKLPLNQESSFVVLNYQRPYNETPWHYHPEYEIVLVLESEGTRIVGDHVDAFQAGDLSFIGPNVPHYYRNTPAYYQGDPKYRTHNIVIHFLEHCFGADFFKTTEMIHVRRLFEFSKRGLDLQGTTRAKVQNLMIDILQQAPLKRLVTLLEILDCMAHSKELRYICNYNMVGTHPKDSDKINQIFTYVLQGFKDSISVKEIAERVNMSETGFSRYFRLRTRKTFSQFVQEIKIGEAKRMLIETDQTVTEIAYSCGYNNLSNFNRQFRKLTHLNPETFRKQLLDK